MKDQRGRNRKLISVTVDGFWVGTAMKGKIRREIR
jgi:hypothetical protein